MKVFCTGFILLAVILIVQQSNGQIPIGFADYGGWCSKAGAAWFLTGPCKNYNGTVECRSNSCGCNLGEYAYFDVESQVCLGLVGAFCTAEKTNLIPGKQCTPNADCFPSAPDHTVGTCGCLYGYKEVNGRCEVDPEIGDNARSTRRPTTTTQAPDKGSIKLPLDMLLGTAVTFGENCDGSFGSGSLFPVLNRTTCNLHERTVMCINNKCACNIGADAHFDQKLVQCVGLAGSYCLTRKNLLGYKGCTEGADCYLEDGVDANHSFGTCQCMYGYNENDDGTCERDPDIPNPSTRAPGGPTEPTPSTSTTPRGSRSTTPGGASQLTGTLSIILMLSFMYFLVQ